MLASREKKSILGLRVDSTSYEDAAQRIFQWASFAESRYVCLANVHMVMEAWDSTSFQNVVNQADLVTPDGMPLVWSLRLKGVRSQKRVYGPDLMLHVLEEATKKGIPVGFYGGRTDVLDKLVRRMKTKYSGLNIAFSFSPPFHTITQQEDNDVIERINASGARILFVGIGCPKQEKWMAEHRGKIPAVMVGVGAGFDFNAGVKRQAPSWMQSRGLEWLFRLIQEPCRLGRRYIYNNPRFVLYAAAEMLGVLDLNKRNARKVGC